MFSAQYLILSVVLNVQNLIGDVDDAIPQVEFACGASRRYGSEHQPSTSTMSS